MELQIIAIGKRLPEWIDSGFATYAKRMQHECTLKLREIASIKRTKTTSIEKIKQQETEQLQNSISPNSIVIALDEIGTQWSTRQLAEQLDKWRNDSKNVNFLIGGPDGLDKTCLSKANSVWSLSKLTLPHPIVRIILAEQLYRAWSLLNNHPYHRD